MPALSSMRHRNESNQTGCGVSGDTLQYDLEESVSHRRTRQVTQLFTNLLTHKLFSSCIRLYTLCHVLATEWCQSYLPCYLLLVSSCLFFFHVESRAAAAAYVVYLISDIGLCRKCGKYVPCTRRTVQGKNFKLILTVTRRLRLLFWMNTIQYSTEAVRYM